MKQKGARLGQHFLKNPHYAEMLVREAGISQDDIALEIGPGEGALTKFLLQAAKKTVVIEKDELLAEKLKETFAPEVSSGRLQIITGDVRDFSPEDAGLSPGQYVLAANIPYYITGEIMRQFLSTKAQPRTMALLIQKEVATRIVSDKESILSVSVKVYGTPRIAAKVSKGNFNPPPQVDSAIIVVNNISKKSFLDLSEEDFFRVVRAGFAAKRKKLSNNLDAVSSKERIAAAFQSLGLEENIRSENLTTTQWLTLAKMLSARE